MYCPVYGCNSATKVIKDKILVFSNFHRRKTVRDEKRGLTSASEKMLHHPNIQEFVLITFRTKTF